MAPIVAGRAISFVGVAIDGLVSLFMSVVTVFKILAAVVAAILSPIGLVTATVVALAGYLIYTSEAGSLTLGWLGEQFNGLKQMALAPCQGVFDAVAAGDIGLAARAEREHKQFGTQSSSFCRQSGIVKVKNVSGSHQVRFTVLGLTELITLPVVHEP